MNRNLHTPSAISAISAGHTNGINGTETRTLAELTAEKGRMEQELSALSSLLDSHGVHMDTRLTTIDGFPRSDIDVATIRTTRARIIHLRNDYKSLMAKVELAIHEQFAALEAQGATDGPAMATDPAPSVPIRVADRSAPPDVPFATVDEVTAGSPAATSGLQVGDEISRFGAANHLNHDRLKKVAEVVSQNEGRPISVFAVRGGSEVRLTLTPVRNWGGRGMLGCHLVPL